MKSVFFLALLFLGACNQALSLYYPDGTEMKKLDFADLVQEVPSFAERPNVIKNLGATPTTSSHLVWLQEQRGEQAHIHKDHDLTVMLLKGKGTLTVSGNKLQMRPGMLITIPRGTPHFLFNESKFPAASYLVFTPPFDGKDVIPQP